MLDDIRYAARSLRRAPAFTLLVAATLAIGSGARGAHTLQAFVRLAPGARRPRGRLRCRQYTCPSRRGGTPGGGGSTSRFAPATSRDVFNLIVLRGLGLAVAGVAVGLAAAIALTRALQAMLFGVDRLDSTTYVMAILVLLLSAAAASYWPARRASRTDPLVALRNE